METYDVAVIGAGLAGLQCARLLGRAGWRVLLVDGKVSLDRGIHTTGIFVRKTFEDFDLPQDCLGPPVREVKLYSPRRRTMTLVSGHEEFRVGRMAALYGRLLEECRREGVAWAPATRYAGCEPYAGCSLLRLDAEGRSRWIQARYVVGADGARSLVAQDLELDVNREWIVGVEEVVTGLPAHATARLHCFLDPVLAPGYLAWVVENNVAVLPGGDRSGRPDESTAGRSYGAEAGEVHVGVGGYASRFDPLDALKKFKESLRGIVPLLPQDGAATVERRGGRIPVGGVLLRLANRRGLLVGDAAGAPSPLTAGGLDPCMRLSALAARVVTDYLKTGSPAALEPYSGRRFRSRFISRRWMRRALAAVRHPLPLELACAALRTPPLRPFVRHVFFGRGSFPDVSPRPRVFLQTARRSS